MSGWVLAIDFGTSFTTAAVLANERAELLEIDNSRYLPSLVFADAEAGFLVGEHAVSRAEVFPEQAERTPKRALVRGTPVRLGNQDVSAADLVAAVLAKVYAEATRRYQGTPDRVLLTYPARWGEAEKGQLADAAEKAGLPAPQFVSEPVAAAFYYAALDTGRATMPEGRSVAVYDLGGGTFDTAVLRSTGDGFELAGPAGGDQQLGGEDFDAALLDIVDQHATSVEPQAWDKLKYGEGRPAVRGRFQLRRDVTKAKHALSEAMDAYVLPQGLADDVRVTRAEFEERITEPLARTVGELQATIKGAGITQDDLDVIYLTGGASRVPRVSDLLAQTFGALPKVAPDPKGVVALGALATLTAAGDATADDGTVEEGPGGGPVDSKAAARGTAGLALTLVAGAAGILALKVGPFPGPLKSLVFGYLGFVLPMLAAAIALRFTRRRRLLLPAVLGAWLPAFAAVVNDIASVPAYHVFGAGFGPGRLVSFAASTISDLAGVGAVLLLAGALAAGPAAAASRGARGSLSPLLSSAVVAGAAAWATASAAIYHFAYQTISENAPISRSVLTSGASYDDYYEDYTPFRVPSMLIGHLYARFGRDGGPYAIGPEYLFFIYSALGLLVAIAAVRYASRLGDRAQAAALLAGLCVVTLLADARFMWDWGLRPAGPHVILNAVAVALLLAGLILAVVCIRRGPQPDPGLRAAGQPTRSTGTTGLLVTLAAGAAGILGLKLNQFNEPPLSLVFGYAGYAVPLVAGIVALTARKRRRALLPAVLGAWLPACAALVFDIYRVPGEQALRAGFGGTQTASVIFTTLGDLAAVAAVVLLLTAMPRLARPAQLTRSGSGAWVLGVGVIAGWVISTGVYAVVYHRLFEAAYNAGDLSIRPDWLNNSYPNYVLEHFYQGSDYYYSDIHPFVARCIASVVIAVAVAIYATRRRDRVQGGALLAGWSVAACLAFLQYLWGGWNFSGDDVAFNELALITLVVGAVLAVTYARRAATPASARAAAPAAAEVIPADQVSA